jgi:hypothetical protein
VSCCILTSHYIRTGTAKEAYKVPVMRIPGAIEAENYKYGRQGVAYYNIFNGEPDTAVNNVLRQSELSIELADKDKTYAYTNIGEVVVGWTVPGEWITYDVSTHTTHTSCYIYVSIADAI